jgi:metacaspase-1
MAFYPPQLLNNRYLYCYRTYFFIIPVLKITLMKREALLVGINDYKGINDLQGCINDVTNVRSILKTYFGFTNDEIRVLTDSRATRANILNRLEKMINLSTKGDYLIFHFSGHGSQIRDREGDELSDHMDELICPYDMNWDDGFITDDMLRQILSHLKKGVRMEILLDSCHSGTGTRELNPCTGTTGFRKNRFMAPPVDIECRYQGDEEHLKPVSAFRTDSGITLNHILWAGCRDNQTSADAIIDGHPNGAFSYYFCKHIRDSSGKITRADLHNRIRNSLRYNHFDQVPQLECQNIYKNENIFKQ